MVRSLLLGMLLAAAPASVAQVTFTPEPRWREEPDTAELCRIALTECRASLQGGTLRGEVAFEELYDGLGRLVGIRLASGSGCAPLDEKVLLERRDFHLAFRDGEEPDLEQIRLELPGGAGASDARIVKQGSASLSIACSAAASPTQLSNAAPGYLPATGTEPEITPGPDPLTL